MNDSDLNSQCECGEARFNVSGKPLMRAFCHCTICQTFNQAAYSDITLFRARDVIMPQQNSVEYKAYASPKIIQRGKCVSCGKAAIEYLKLPLMPKLFVVPTNNIADKRFVPEPSLHVFYDTRVSDIEDNLPKHSGYLKSQLAFSHKLMASFIHG